MKAILTICLMIHFLEATAQEIVWYNGSIVLADNSVAVGEVARQSQELILFRAPDKKVTVYPAHRISSFRYYDETENVNRVFISIASRHYERIVNGRITVLRIQKQFDQEISEKHQDQFDFFIVEGKRISSLRSFRTKYFDRIKDELDHGQVDYRQFDPNTRHGAVSLIMLYNKTGQVLVSRSL